MKTVMVISLFVLMVAATDGMDERRQADHIGQLSADVHKCIFNVVKDNPAVLKKVQGCLSEGPNALKCFKNIYELAECLKDEHV